MIYFLQPPDGGPIKIGYSADVPARQRALEKHYGCPLVLLATMEGGRDVERQIHERFASSRFGRTEQFRPTADLMTFIGRPLLVDPNPDAVEAMKGKSVFSVPASEKHREWMIRFMEAINEDDIADVFREAVRRWADSVGFEAPPRR